MNRSGPHELLSEQHKVLEWWHEFVGLVAAIVLVSSGVKGQNSGTSDADPLQDAGMRKCETVGPPHQHRAPLETTMERDPLFDLLDWTKYGDCKAVGINEGYLFAGNGLYFQVLDATTPDSLRLVWEQLLGGDVTDIAVHGSELYVLDANSLHAYDISDPANPIALSSVSLPTYLVGLTLDQSFAFVTSWPTGTFYCVDISNPRNLLLRSQVGTGLFYPAHLASAMPYVYVSGRNETGTVVVDATDPGILVASSVITTNSGGGALAIHDSLLFQGGLGNLYCFSISTPHTPVLLDTAGIEEPIVSITSIDTIAYCMTRNPARIYSISFADPRALRVLAIFERAVFTNVPGSKMAVAGNTLCAAYSSGLLCIRRQACGEMEELAFWSTPEECSDVVRHDGILYIAAGPSGLWIADARDIHSVRSLSNLRTGGLSSALAEQAGMVYLLNATAGGYPDSLAGVTIIDVQDQLSPRVVASYPVTDVRSIEERSGFLFLSRQGSLAGDTVIQILDVRDPQHPSTAQVLMDSNSIIGCSVSDSLIAMSFYLGGLRIYRWGPGMPPTLLSTPMASSGSVLLDGTILYVETADTLVLLDVSTPTSPIEVGRTLRGWGWPVQPHLLMKKEGNRLYWSSTSTAWIGLFDVSNPTTPVNRGRMMLPFGGGAKGLAPFGGDTLAAACRSGGVLFFKVGTVSDVKGGDPSVVPQQELDLTQNYPNPFNATTTAVVRMHHQERTTITLVDVLGKEVCILYDGVVGPGEFQIHIQLQDYPTGVYFLVARAQGKTVSRKMLLIR